MEPDILRLQIPFITSPSAKPWEAGSQQILYFDGKTNRSRERTALRSCIDKRRILQIKYKKYAAAQSREAKVVTGEETGRAVMSRCHCTGFIGLAPSNSFYWESHLRLCQVIKTAIGLYRGLCINLTCSVTNYLTQCYSPSVQFTQR